MKKRYIALLVIIGIGLLGYSQRTTLVAIAMQKGMEARLGGSRTDSLGDGLHLALCGAGGPMPAPKASGACVAVLAGPYFMIVDVGTDSPRNLNRMNYNPGTVDAVFLTHYHSDHIDGLGELATFRWAAGEYESPLPVYGPEGVTQVVDGFNKAYSQDFVYRHEHHGDTVAPVKAAGLEARPFAEPAVGELVTVFEADGLRVETLKVNHIPVTPAVGYRFSYKGRTLLISGDTTKFENIERFAKGIDLLVHEALAPNLVGIMNRASISVGNRVLAKITTDIPDYHATPVEAAETARDAGVGHLLYYHIVPPLIVPGQEELWLNGAEDIFANYTVGQDGVQFSLPPNSTEIIKTKSGL